MPSDDIRGMRPNLNMKCGPVVTGIIFFLAMTIWLLMPCVVVAAAEGKRFSAAASAQSFAPGYNPQMAVDENESTMWIASLTPQVSNNQVWFQLDLGKIRQIARLHWFAADGTPYPASAPYKYQVLVSNDGSKWSTVFSSTAERSDELIGDVLINADGRYVRLTTTQINDGTGWALGLREIWVTEGHDTSASSAMWQIWTAMSDRRIDITWLTPHDSSIKRLHVYRASTPTAVKVSLLADLDAHNHGYSDTVDNWTPYYYWVQAMNEKGQVINESARVAAVAHPAENAAKRVEAFAFWYEPYKPATNSDNSLSHIGKASFVVGPDNSSALNDLSKAGVGVLPYITLYQTHVWSGSFSKDDDASKVIQKIGPTAYYRKAIRFPGSPQGYLPTIFCRPGSEEYNPKAIQYTTCPNSVPFRDMVLGHVSKALSEGAAGFFVDNGYPDDMETRFPCESTRHSHYYGENLTPADAFLGMLLEITCAVKRKNPQGIVMINGDVAARANYYGLRLNDVSDGQLWEGYLFGPYSNIKEHIDNWESVYRRSIDLEKAWLAAPPRRMYVLCYPWDRNEAFFCYATARLSNLPWSADLGISDPAHSRFGGHFGTYPELVNIRLGAPKDVRQFGGEKIGEVYIRRYEQGIVAVNPTHKAQNAVIELEKSRIYRDVYDAKISSGHEIKLLLPPGSGRVFLYQ